MGQEYHLFSADASSAPRGSGGRRLPSRRGVPQLSALGVYIFAGGFTIGVSKHFDVQAHFEGLDGYGVSTFQLNYPEIPVHIGDAESWPTKKYSPSFIYANPPCAIWSPLGVSMTRGRDAWKTDPRTSCWRNAFAMLEKMTPHFLAIESVPQAYTKGKPLIDELTQEALDLDYSVTHLFVDGQFLGLPQRRRRFFFVAHDRAVDFMPRNWAPAWTAWEVIREIDDPGFVYRTNPTRLPSLKEAKAGEGLKRAWYRLHGDDPEKWDYLPNGKVKGRPLFMESRLSKTRVAGTFTGNYWYHPTKNRRLGHREILALCGWPLDYQFDGEPRKWPSLIARSVLPPVGEWIASCVRTALEMNVPEKGNVHKVDLRKPPRE